MDILIKPVDQRFVTITLKGTYKNNLQKTFCQTYCNINVILQKDKINLENCIRFHILESKKEFKKVTLCYQVTDGNGTYKNGGKHEYFNTQIVNGLGLAFNIHDLFFSAKYPIGGKK